MADQRNVDGPLYRDVYERLRDRIVSGEYQAGTGLPSEPKLGKEFGVSAITIRRAVHELVLDGLIEPRQGLGNIVRSASDSPVVVGMSSFTSDVVNGRLRLVRTLLADDYVPASRAIAEKLGVQPASMVRHLVRFDYEGNAPFSVDEVFIPPSLASSITPEIASSPEFMHLWQRTSGLELVRTEYEIWVERAGPDDERLLRVPPESPVLTTGELIYDSSGRPIAYVVSRYRGDRGRLRGSIMLVVRETERGVVGE